MIDIKQIAPPMTTQVDPAPKATPRANPADVAIEKIRQSGPDGVERRKNPDRRRAGRGSDPFDRRLGADRRRRTVDIQV